VEIQWEPDRSPFLSCAEIRRRKGVLLGKLLLFKVVIRRSRRDKEEGDGKE
jgi:hypothetical protein